MSRDPQLYLADILEAGVAILAYTEGMNEETFKIDRKTVDASIRCFEIIGEATKRLPAEWTAREPDIPWSSVAGFRDVLAHAYFQTDEAIVWRTITSDLPLLLDACRRLSR